MAEASIVQAQAELEKTKLQKLEKYMALLKKILLTMMMLQAAP
uniref:Uncharacterized protein n=1 Tax=Arundo donax TaxID=35708 RepID=A0A0A9DWJ1_ARUDO